MKRIWMILLLMVLMTGCSAKATFETLSDVYDVPAMAQIQQVELTLPQEAAVPSMENPAIGRIYLCEGYTVTVQTMDAGDLDRTLRQLTGYGKEQLTVMQTQRDGVDCCQCVWTAAGEGGDQVGRAVILDDGNYHYAVTVMAGFSDAGKLTSVWQNILDSVKLVRID